MSTSATMMPETVIAALRAHAAELRQAGIRHLDLFGSLARGEATDESDIDLVAEFDPEARIGLFRLVAIERRLKEILGRDVDLLAEPIEQQRLRTSIARHRRSAF
jgi:uncharacterized protein